MKISEGTRAELRRWYRREMLHIQTASICESQPIFETLERTSALADTVIARAYEIAVTDIWGAVAARQRNCGSSRSAGSGCANSISPPTPTWSSSSPIPNRRRMEQWTRVAGRLIDLVTAYTGEGVLFAVERACVPTAATALWCKPKAP